MKSKMLTHSVTQPPKGGRGYCSRFFRLFVCFLASLQKSTGQNWMTFGGKVCNEDQINN